MSLLMEALRKAEAAKRAGQSGVPDTDVGTSAHVEPETTSQTIQTAPEVFKYTSSDDLIALSPREEPPVEAQVQIVPAAPPTPVATPPESRINNNDDVLDDYLTTSNEPELDELPARQPSRDRIKVQQQRQRAAAASMFDAKTPQENSSKRRQRTLILAGVLAVAAVLVGSTGWYVTKMAGKSAIGVNQSIANYNLEKRGPLGEPPAGTPTPATGDAAPTQIATPPGTPPPAVAVAAQIAEVAPSTSAAPNAKVDAAPDASKTSTTAPNTSKPAEAALAVSDPQPTGRPADSTRPVATPNTAATTATNTAAPDSPPSSNVLEISRSNAPSRIQPALLSAYTQLQKGNLSAANDLYQELATRYPNNRDALLGLASVQLQLGNQNGARSTYMYLLKLNPLDALARTGMLQAIPSADAATYEKELLALRQQFPSLAPLSYALGNHYAQTARWHEAQSAYFDALLQARRESPDNISPDYAFNLAVSLEQLGKKSTALEYYKQAQLLANTVKPGFDPMMLRQRLTELELQK